MLPQFFIIGAQKSGSTYLLQCLADHPRVYMPRYEVPFLETEPRGAAELDDLARHYSGATEGQVVGGKRANLLGRSARAGEMRELLPDLRLIAILRHPIERTVSGYFHYMASGFIPIAPIEQGLARIIHGEYSDFPRAFEVLDFGLYGKHLAAYFAAFPREQLHVVLFDDIKVRAAEEVKAVYQFLGVDPAFQPTFTGKRPMQATYSLTRLRLRQPLDQFCREPSSRRTAQVYRRGPVATSLRGVNSLADRLLWSRLFRSGPPPLPPELADKLVDLFRGDVQQLEQLLGRPLPTWQDPPSRSRG